MEQSIIAAARAAASKVRDRRLDIEVPELNIVLTCRIPADGAEIERAINAAKRVEKGNVAGTHSNRAVVALCTDEIAYQGKAFVDASGQPLAFRDPELWRELGDDIDSQKAAVLAILGSDGFVKRVAEQLLDEAGYTDEDPS